MSVATIEIAQHRGIPGSSTEVKETGDSPIIPFTDVSARDLARQYIGSKSLSESVYHRTDAYRLGELEIQGQVLIMLGQEHLLNDLSESSLISPPLLKLKPITRRDIELLSGSYRVAKYYCQTLEQVKETNGKTPGNERIRGRKDTLAEILEDLGQVQIVRSIDREIRMRPEFVQWGKDRNERSKGETY